MMKSLFLLISFLGGTEKLYQLLGIENHSQEKEGLPPCEEALFSNEADEEGKGQRGCDTSV